MNPVRRQICWADLSMDLFVFVYSQDENVCRKIIKNNTKVGRRPLSDNRSKHHGVLSSSCEA